MFQTNRVVQIQRSILLSSSFLLLLRCLIPHRTSITFGGQKCTSTDQVFTAYLWGTECYWPPRKLGQYHDIIEYHDINLETISISDGFGFNRNIDISRYIAISIKYRDVFASLYILHPMGLE